MSNIDKQALREAAEKATALNLDTAQVKSGNDGYLECPCCDSAGYVEEESDFCNIDGVALGVQFYGIGEHYGLAESYLRAANPATVLALLDELEDAEKQILKLEKLAEYESVGADKAAASCVEWMKRCHDAEKRIAELEAREVVLPQCYSMLHRVDFDEPYHTEMVYRQHQVLEALHNAGINVTEAGKGEAS